MIDLGTVRPGTTLYIPFNTFDSKDPSASVTLTGLATTDIEIYKNGSVTQRASDSGYALLDTDGIDFDSTTGIHGFSVDLADNTTAGFYSAGAQYWIVVASITVAAATVNFVAATFRIGYPDAVLNTTIATLSTQTSFTLTDGPAEASALLGCPVIIHDVASAVQIGHGIISAYAATTKTVTLAAGTTFTAAATDNIAIYPPSNARWVGSVASTPTTLGTQVWATTTRVLTAATNLTTALATPTNITGGTITTVTNVTNLHASAATAAELAKVPKSDGTASWNATALAAIEGEVDDALATYDAPTKAELDTLIGTPAADVSADIAAVKAETALIVADTNELQTDDIPTLIAALQTDLDTLTDASGEPTGVPAASATLLTKVGYLYMALRNQVDVTASKKTFYDDGGAAEWEKDLTDNGTTYSESEGNAI